MQAQRSPIVAETVPSRSEQDTTSEPDSEPRYYAARPDLLMEKCKQLEKLPYVMVESGPYSESSERRRQQLHAEFRQAEKLKLRPNVELESTILGYPLLGNWPKIEPEDESDPEYPLAETEEEWFAWKQRVDTKRAQKRQIASHGTRKADVPKTVVELNKRLTVAKIAGIPQASTDAKGKENERAKMYRSSQLVAPESQWNDKSIENALQSTPVQHRRQLVVDYVPPAETPPSQLASPPDSGLQLHAAAPFANARTPSRSQKYRHEKPTAALQYSQSTNKDRVREPLREPSYVSHAVSSESIPRTPVSPEANLARREPLFSPPGSAPMPRRNVDGWRRHTALAAQQSQQNSSQNSHARQHSQPSQPSQQISSRHSQARQYSQQAVSHPSQQSVYAASQTTTHYLYGSQEVRVHRPQLRRSNSFSQEPEEETVKRSDAYMKELEEELERERKIFDMNKAVTGNRGHRQKSRPLSQPTGAWDVGSFEEETEFKSQEAKRVSAFVENDLGNPYRGEPYAAFNPGLGRYQNPYDD